jgi:DNA-binding transcriptional LysR family regulator
MTTEQLRYAVSIAEGGSFSQAAGEFNISQPAVSKQVRNFEWELGCKLFERDTKKTTLTPAGQKLYPQLKDLLLRYDSLLREAREFSTGKQILRVVCLPLLGQYEITPALRRFEMEHPGIELKVTEEEEPGFLKSLESCDFVITREKILPPRYQRWPIAKDELALFVNENHPLAGRNTVTLDLLRNETFMLMPKYTSIYQQCMELLSSAGIPFRLDSCARIETIISNIECGRCVSLLMARAEGVFRSSLIRVIPLDPPCPSVIVAAYCGLNEKEPAARLFVDFLRNSAQPDCEKPPSA